MALAKDGANIVVNGLGTEKDNEKAIAEVKALGTRVAFDPANMLRHNQIAEMIAKAERDFGSVDILVNNAGIQHVAPVEEFPIEQWDSIIAINLTSAFHTTRAAVPGMKKRKWGRIINICSAHSLRASPFKSAYVSAKHGLAGFTKTVALELAEHGVTCQRDLARLRVDAAGREADPRPRQVGEHHAGAGQEAGAVAAADQAVRDGGAGRRAGGVPGERGGSLDHRRQLLDRRRLDRAVAGAAAARYCVDRLAGCLDTEGVMPGAPLPRNSAAVMNAAAATVSSTAMTISRIHRRARALKRLLANIRRLLHRGIKGAAKELFQSAKSRATDRHIARRRPDVAGAS